MTVDVVASSSLLDIETFFRSMPGKAEKAAVMAVNTTAQRVALKRSREEIEKQVNFPQGYLNDDRLFLAKKARGDDIEAIIKGRDRPTSLARFGTAQGKGKGVRVEVKRGRTVYIKKAFLVKLNVGENRPTADQYNQGLAIRLKPGERVLGKYKQTQLDKGVYLLYGPSVDQVFRTVADDISPEIAESLGKEFLRNFTRLTGGQ